MPARRLVVAVASGLTLLSLMISAPSRAATRNDGGNRTTTTERQRRNTTTTEKARRTTTTDDRETATTHTSHATSTSEAPSAGTHEATSTSTSARSSTSTTEKREHSDRYIVVLKKGNDSATVADDHIRHDHVKVSHVFGHAVRGYAADIPDNELDAIKKDSRVAYVEKNKPLKKQAQTLPWGVERVSRDGTDWSSTRPGDGTGAVGIDIYIIDTGISANADLNGTTDYSSRGGPPTDCDGHGTHMAGIVGAMDNSTGVVGVAPGARLHGIKVLDCSGRGTDIDAVAGLDWVVAHGAHPSVITMSFGGAISQAFDDAVRRALSAGFVMTVAAGNDGGDACKHSPAHMGVLDGVITVGATTKRDRPANFSDRGKCVDVWAPGVQILSYFLNGQMAIGTGTSASAPHVAGVAALYLFGPGSDAPADTERAIKANAVHIAGGRLLMANAAHF